MAGGAIRHQIVGGPAKNEGQPAPLETDASLPQVPWWQARAFSVFLGLGILVIVAASVYLGVLIRDRQHEFGEISRYNTTWVTSQAALEVAKLEAALPDGCLTSGRRYWRCVAPFESGSNGNFEGDTRRYERISIRDLHPAFKNA